MSRRILTSVVIMALFIVSAVPSFASSKEITKDYTFYSLTEDFNYTENQTIEIDGKKYNAVKTDYEIIEELQKETIKKKFENVKKDEIAKEITEGGKTYKIKGEPQFAAKNYTHTETLHNSTSDNDFPLSYTWNSEGIELVGDRIDIVERRSEELDTPFVVKAKFIGDEDCLFYELNGKRISSSNAPEFRGYEKELLAYLNLNANDFKVETGKWDGDFYNADGNVVRNAVFAGHRRGLYTSAIYQATLYDAEVEYEVVPDKSKPAYKVKATISYEKEGLTTLQKVIIGTAAVVLIAIVIAIILMLMRRREKEEKEEKEK